MRKMRRHNHTPLGVSLTSGAMLLFSIATFIVFLWVVMVIVRVVTG